jgi:hypothetical protein
MTTTDPAARQVSFVRNIWRMTKSGASKLQMGVTLGVTINIRIHKPSDSKESRQQFDPISTPDSSSRKSKEDY